MEQALDAFSVAMLSMEVLFGICLNVVLCAGIKECSNNPVLWSFELRIDEKVGSIVKLSR